VGGREFEWKIDEVKVEQESQALSNFLSKASNLIPLYLILPLGCAGSKLIVNPSAMAPRDLIVKKVRAEIQKVTDGLPDDHLPDGHLVGESSPMLQSLLTVTALVFVFQAFLR